MALSLRRPNIWRRSTTCNPARIAPWSGLPPRLNTQTRPCPSVGALKQDELPSLIDRVPGGGVAGSDILFKANYVAPWKESAGTRQIDLSRVKGVVLFLHGFSQGPPAYSTLLQELADTGVLVIGPSPPTASTPQVQQTGVMKAALHWEAAIADDSRTQDWEAWLGPLPADWDTIRSNRGLMGHSLGGGLAAHVAYAAAEAGRPFKGVHVMAPQISLLVDDFSYNHICKWPAGSGQTAWGIQWGRCDLLTTSLYIPPVFPTRWVSSQSPVLAAWLLAVGQQLPQPPKCYPWGSHVGLKDQLVWNGTSFVGDLTASIRALRAGVLGPPAAQPTSLALPAAAPIAAPLLAANRMAMAVAPPPDMDQYLDPAAKAELKAWQDRAIAAQQYAPDRVLEMVQQVYGAPDLEAAPNKISLPSEFGSYVVYGAVWLLLGYLPFAGVVRWVSGGDVNLPAAAWVTAVASNAWHWLVWLGHALLPWLYVLLKGGVVAVTGMLLVLGLLSLLLLGYEWRVQRPESRSVAVQFFRQHLGLEKR